MTSSRRLLYAALTLLVVALLTEGVVRLTGLVSGTGYTARTGIQWGLSANLQQQPFWTVDNVQFNVSTNSVGLRSVHEPTPDPEATTILWLGDSIIFGWGVPDHRAVPVALEEALSQLRPDRRWRVINAGQPGFSSYQSLLLFEELGLAYEPDLVLMELVGHNFRRAPQPDADQLVVRPETALAFWLHRNVHTYALLRRMVLSLTAPPVAEGMEHAGVDQRSFDQGDRRRVPPGHLLEVCEAIDASAAKNDFRVVLTQPGFMRQIPDDYIAYFDEAEALEHVSRLDYGAEVERAGLNSQRFWVDQSYHWNGTGAREVGTILARQVEAAGLLGEE